MLAKVLTNVVLPANYRPTIAISSSLLKKRLLIQLMNLLSIYVRYGIMKKYIVKLFNRLDYIYKYLDSNFICIT